MFDQWAFQTWTRVFVGAAVFAAAFFGLMTVAATVVDGNPAEFDRATRVISAAAFVGYVGTAWILRRGTREGESR